MSRRWLLAIDTATSIVVVGVGDPGGEPIDSRTVPALHRHGSRLLSVIDAVTAELGLQLADLEGVVVGTGPGAFTGLRVGLATAKTLAHELGIPVVGVSTAEALLASQPTATRLLLPAGPHDRTVVDRGRPPRLVAGEDGEAEPASAMAIDLPGRASAGALARGADALEQLPRMLLRLGAARLTAGRPDDVARLVPEYVSLPRGVAQAPEGGVTWSRDPR